MKVTVIGFQPKKPMFRETTKVPGNKCPNCHHEIEGATGERKPSEGDYSICAYCLCLLIFNPDLTLRFASEQDIQGMHFDNLIMLMVVRWRMFLGYAVGVFDSPIDK
jgi:hypothetical protein